MNKLRFKPEVVGPAVRHPAAFVQEHQFKFATQRCKHCNRFSIDREKPCVVRLRKAYTSRPIRITPSLVEFLRPSAQEIVCRL